MSTLNPSPTRAIHYIASARSAAIALIGIARRRPPRGCAERDRGACARLPGGNSHSDRTITGRPKLAREPMILVEVIR